MCMQVFLKTKKSVIQDYAEIMKNKIYNLAPLGTTVTPPSET